MVEERGWGSRRGHFTEKSGSNWCGRLWLSCLLLRRLHRVRCRGVRCCVATATARAILTTVFSASARFEQRTGLGKVSVVVVQRKPHRLSSFLGVP